MAIPQFDPIGNLPPDICVATARHHGNPIGNDMIENDKQLLVTLDRTTWLQKQVMKLRETEDNPANYRSSAAGFLAEIDRMQLEVREYLMVPPAEADKAA